MTFPMDPSTPIADALGEMPHMVPDELAKRLRSETCREGGDGCHDPLCLCTCHDQDFPADPPDATLRAILDGLDAIIGQVPGSWKGFDEPAPWDPRVLYPEARVVIDEAGDAYQVGKADY